MENTESTIPGLYERAARNGSYFGLYLTALFFANAYAQSVPLLAMAGLAMMVAVPVIIYMCLARSFRVTNLCASYSELWLEGIATFFFATLLVSLIAVVFMMWLQPQWLDDQVAIAISHGETSGMPQLEEMAQMLKLAVEQHMLPTPIRMTLDMGWLMMFTGSLLSMLMAAIVRRIKR